MSKPSREQITEKLTAIKDATSDNAHMTAAMERLIRKHDAKDTGKK